MKYLYFCLALTIAIISSGLYANPLIDVPLVRIQAKSYILMDSLTGEVIAQKNAEKRMPPASITKIMTLYIIADSLANGSIELEQEVNISVKAWKTGGSRMFIEAGKNIKVSDLIQGIAVTSGNDATIAMSEYISGSEENFVKLMNQTAKKLGMLNTNYTNVSGLPNPDLYTSAKDIAILSNSLIRKHYQFYKTYLSQKKFTFNGISQINRNKLLWSQQLDVDGIKTGHTKEAGYNLAVSAIKNNFRLIAVLLGGNSKKARAREGEKLLRWGFRYFRRYHLYDALTELTETPLWMGDRKTLPLGVAEPIDLIISRAKPNQLNVKIQVKKYLTAPITTGQRVGDLLIYIGEKEYQRHSLISLEDAGEGSILSRAIDWIKMNLFPIFN